MNENASITLKKKKKTEEVAWLRQLRKNSPFLSMCSCQKFTMSQTQQQLYQTEYSLTMIRVHNDAQIHHNNDTYIAPLWYLEVWLHKCVYSSSASLRQLHIVMQILACNIGLMLVLYSVIFSHYILIICQCQELCACMFVQICILKRIYMALALMLMTVARIDNDTDFDHVDVVIVPPMKVLETI